MFHRGWVDRRHLLLPHRNHISFRNRPPAGNLFRESGDNFRILHREVSGFVRIGNQVVKLRTFLGAWMGRFVTTDFAVVSEQQLPLSFHDPAVNQRVLRFVDPTNIVTVRLQVSVTSVDAVSGQGDGLLRRTFSKTIAIRNRV